MIHSKTTFTFSFDMKDKKYEFNVISSSREEALKILRTDLATIISDINGEEK